ncbi:MAG: hypothetical protein RQ758_08925, partial [Methanomicrobiaceae archaeon]|nr:hypothetical protein [Methanomicrobiaceae archaeon]
FVPAVPGQDKIPPLILLRAVTVSPGSDPFFRSPDKIEIMVTTREIIRKIWDAQGYGNIAVYRNGSTAMVMAGETGEREGEVPAAIFKPIVLVGKYPMLDHALGDIELLEEIENRLKESGLTIERGE